MINLKLLKQQGSSMIRFKLLMFLMFGMSFSVLAMERQHSFQPAPQQHGQWIQQARGQVAEVDRRQQAAAERQRDVGQVIRDLLDQVRQVTARSTRTVEEADRRLQAIVERQRDVRRIIRDLLEQDMSPENMLQLVRQSGLSDNAIRLILRQVEEEDRRQHYVEQVIRDLSQEDMSPEDIIQRLSGWSDDVIRPCLQEFLERIQQDKQMQEDHEMTLRLDEEEQENERNREAAQRVHEEEVRRQPLKLGDRVARGPDWQWGNQDGGDGSLGTVTKLTGISGEVGWVSVKWDVTGEIWSYRLGAGGKTDLIKQKEEEENRMQ